MARPRNIPINREYIELLCKHFNMKIDDVAKECGLYTVIEEIDGITAGSFDKENFYRAYHKDGALSFQSIRKLVQSFNQKLESKLKEEKSELKKDRDVSIIFEDLVSGSNCPGIFETTKEIDSDKNSKAVSGIRSRRISALSALCAPEDKANTVAEEGIIDFDHLTDNQKEIIVESVRSYIASQSPVWKKVFAGSAPDLHKNE